MIKTAVVAINLASLFLLNLYFGQNVDATSDFPTEVTPSTEYTVSIKITKEDIDGFAKVEQELPVGFESAEPLETQGATFTFKDQKVKFIWMALPPASEITVKYKVKTSANISGSYSVTGRFSYIHNNERTNLDIPETNGKVQEEIVENNTTTTTEPEKTEEPEVKTPSFTAARSIKKIDTKQYEVSITINAENVGNFAKMEEVIPEGFTASELNSNGGMFSFLDGKVKITWMSFVTGNSTVSYRLTAEENTYGTFSVSGKVNYIANKENATYVINSTSITIEKPKEEIVENTTSNNNENTTTSDNNNNSGNNNKVTNTPNPETGISYKVQVAAIKSTFEVGKFKSYYNLYDKVDMELHEGWTKYTVGKFPNYKNARDKRNAVWSNTKIKDAFVTAYNQGTRITVQEALMVSKQQWVK